MAQKKKNEIFLSNIEEQLKKDTKGEFRNDTIETLLQEALKIRKLKQKGTSPEEYTKLENILTALVASMEVVDKRWKNFHQQK